MTVWAHIFLGAIAVGTLITAIIQIGAIVYAGRLARRVERLADRVEHDLRPVLRDLQAVSARAAQAASLVVAQVERADRVFADASQRIDETLSVVQALLTTPAREGAAMMTGLRAALAAFWELRSGSRRRQAGMEEEEALFIG